VDTSTPAGKMIFTVLGAVAELERSLIVERVRAGLRNARAKGKRLGRPRKLTSPEVIGRMRAQGASWRAIGKAIGVSAATAWGAAAKAGKVRLINPSAGAPVSDSFHAA
jgi:DNA invertase Pin-like site-specific DNA recombinase